jgi:hypothetical protein
VGLIALSASQLSAVDELLDRGRLGRVPADLNRASIFAAQAQDAITDLPHLTRLPVRHSLGQRRVVVRTRRDRWRPEHPARDAQRVRTLNWHASCSAAAAAADSRLPPSR